ncbi:hypothetical protein FisN_16Hh309 [Fistulifera solaris]|jgi:hypothetical protein|uniref:CBM6 domain-containing protein n=1 Tax=Fistulifera solaris TaxID=1519565 RepID=A0A1Z5KTE7_FISSO|nr:hypothetical protein FisN_16Hh309 [Fistulifera solaris]|eukprot:GAX29261.1 hypothetical protein FisN_16Hh309 [Fistulifera solaris]
MAGLLSENKRQAMLQILSILAFWCASSATAHSERDLSWGSHNGMFYSLISATNYVESTGAVETITTPDGIRAVGFLDPGDTMGYALDVPIAGMYSLLLHVASPAGEGSLNVENAETTEVYATFDELPSSNGNWSYYQTTGQNITLPQGQLILQVSVLESGFNLMWLSLEQLAEEPFEPSESAAPVAPVAPVPTEPVVPVPTEPVAPVPTEPVVPVPTEPVTSSPSQVQTTAPTMAQTLAPTVKQTPAVTPAPTMKQTPAVTPAPTTKQTQAPTTAPTMKQTPALTPAPTALTLTETNPPVVTELSMYTEQCFSAGNFLSYQGCDELPRGVGFVGPVVTSTMITYPFQVPVAGVYLLQMSVQGMGGVNVTCESTGKQYAYIESLPTYRTTNTTDVWYTVSSVMSLDVGSHKLQVEAVVGGWSIQTLCLLPVASHFVSCSVDAAR